MMYYIVTPIVILCGVYLIANIGLLYSALIVVVIMYIIAHNWGE